MCRPLGLRLKEEETECLSEQLSQEDESSCKEAKVLRSQLVALLRLHVGPMVGAVLSLDKPPPPVDKENRSKRYSVVTYSPASCAQTVES